MRKAFIGIALCVLLASCSLPRSSVVPLPTEDEGAQQAPIKILFGSAELGSEALLASVSRYEQLTGREIEVHTFSHDNIQAKVYNELIQQSHTFDLILINSAWIPLMINHLEPLSAYLQDAAYEDAQLNDFSAKILSDSSLFNPHRLSEKLQPEDVGQ